MRKLAVILLWIYMVKYSVFADAIDDISLFKDRALLRSCQVNGRLLYELCVIPGEGVDAEACAGLLAKYNACLYSLSNGSKLDYAKNPYVGKMFSPCGTAMASLIIADICRR